MKKIVIRFNAPVILSFALLSLIALLLGKWTNGATTTQFFSVYRSSLADPLTYVRFFGHVLGHSSYEHYMGNMLLLLLVGPGLEEKYGSGTMVWTIAGTALVTAPAQKAAKPKAEGCSPAQRKRAAPQTRRPPIMAPMRAR